MQIFDVIIFFKLRTIQQKTVKPTYLCPLDARKLAEGKGHETAWQEDDTRFLISDLLQSFMSSDRCFQELAKMEHQLLPEDRKLVQVFTQCYFILEGEGLANLKPNVDQPLIKN